MPKITRVLHISAGQLYNAGIETFIMNTYRNIDKSKVKFDFLITTNEEGHHDREFVRLGGNLVKINNLVDKKGHFNGMKYKMKYFLELNKILKVSGTYDAIHYHQQSWCDAIMIIAYLNKIPIRIVHSHNAYLNEKYSVVKNIRIKFREKIINKYSTHRLACSIEASNSLFGEKSLDSKNTQVINNGIDFSDFRMKTNSLDLKNKTVEFINVGRFTNLKNQIFLIELMNIFKNMNFQSHLTIVGWGILENILKSKVDEYKLSEYITFLPNDTNIPNLLQKMDFFLFPSIAGEGLGIVLLEAQATGLPCFVSNLVPKDGDLDLCTYLSIDQGPKHWADEIIKSIHNKSFPTNLNKEKAKAFDITEIANKMEDIYCS